MNNNFKLSEYALSRWVITYFLLIIIDLPILYFFLRPRFLEMTSNRQTLTTDLNAILLTYVLMLAGFFYFVDIERDNILKPFVFGVVTHGIYELTNKATLDGWNWSFVVFDTLWGGLLYSILFFILKLNR